MIKKKRPNQKSPDDPFELASLMAKTKPFKERSKGALYDNLDEEAKAAMDLARYGTSVVKNDSDGKITHVPTETIYTDRYPELFEMARKARSK